MKIYNCGIYQIINIINGKCYVGQSTQLKRRKRDHFRDFRNNVHDNSYLQKSWNKYGESVFSFNILIYCEKYELTRYEQYFSDYYKKIIYLIISASVLIVISAYIIQRTLRKKCPLIVKAKEQEKIIQCIKNITQRKQREP
jgi:group I intron endonuclease